ncbi:MAG: hypothetical protein ABR529_02640 [Actinomycetota bacterium]
MPSPKKREKSKERRARETQAAQQSAERKKITPAQYMRRRTLGWSLVALALAVALSHWLAHAGVLYEDKALWDLTIGFPMAGALAVAGAIVLGGR